MAGVISEKKLQDVRASFEWAMENVGKNWASIQRESGEGGL